jgi:hypothetical protein
MPGKGSRIKNGPEELSGAMFRQRRGDLAYEKATHR